MNPIFTLHYSEAVVIDAMTDTFSGKHGYAVLVPQSRQQKDFDIVLMNTRTKKVVTVQVKSSRYWPSTKANERFGYHTWSSRFAVEKNTSDFYAIHLISPMLSEHGGKQKGVPRWKDKILLLSKEEMKRALDSVKTKAGKPRAFYSFGYDADDGGDVALVVRGKDGKETYSDFPYGTLLLANRVKEIIEKLA